MEDRAKSLELVLCEASLESDTSQGLLLNLVRAGDVLSCREAVASYLFRRALSLGKLPADRLVPPDEYEGLRTGLKSFVTALHPFVLEEPDALEASDIYKAVWLRWVDDQLLLQVPVSTLMTPEEDELAMRGGVMAVVIRALYPDLSPPEAARLSRTLFWALDHPNDALAIISKAKEEGQRPVFPEPAVRPGSVNPSGPAPRT